MFFVVEECPGLLESGPMRASAAHSLYSLFAIRHWLFRLHGGAALGHATRGALTSLRWSMLA